MPSNDERREVAENLRTMTAYGCRYAEQFYELLQETVMNVEDFHDFGDVANRLADLIEPEPERTCRMEPNERGYPVCSNCDEEMNAYTCEWTEPMEYSYPFCYACGAKAVE